MNIGVIFGQMLVLLTMMGIGYFVYRKGWVSDSSAASLSKLVVNVFNPILVINGVLGADSGGAGSRILENLFLVGIYYVIVLAAGVLLPLLLQPQKEWKSIYQLMTIFSNVGFMGIPVVKSIYGDEATVYVAFYLLVYNILLYTLGIFLSKRSAAERRAAAARVVDGEVYNTAAGQDAPAKERTVGLGALKKIINPGVVAALLAVVLFVAAPPIPAPVVTFCDYMGNTTIPLSMLMIGVSVAKTDLKEVFGDWRIYAFIALRMILLPVVMIFALKGILVGAMKIDPVIFGVFVLELGMPVGSIISLLTKEYDADFAYCTKGVVLSTLASIVTIPVICIFL